MNVRVAQPSSYGWIKDRLGLAVSDKFAAVEVVRDDGTIAGMVGYDNRTPNSLSLHIAIETPAALRKLVVAGFVGAFELEGKGLVHCLIRTDNERSLRLVRKLGFRPVALLADAWSPGVGFVIWEMRKEECRYLTPARKAA